VRTREAIAVMKIIIKRSIDYVNEIYVCFVDFEKAFDRVDWTQIMTILRSIRVDRRDRRLVAELYMTQDSVITIAVECSEPGIIGRGVRQGCFTISIAFHDVYRINNNNSVNLLNVT